MAGPLFRHTGNKIEHQVKIAKENREKSVLNNTLWCLDFVPFENDFFVAFLLQTAAEFLTNRFVRPRIFSSAVSN